MTRIACLRVAQFVAAAHERCEPALRERPLLVVAGRLPSTRVVDANLLARSDGVRPGITYAEAVARCPAGVVRERSDVRVAAAYQALLDAALGVSPRVESMGGPELAPQPPQRSAAPRQSRGAPRPRGPEDETVCAVYVELDGLERLFGDETSLARRLIRAARMVGLVATVGVAGSRTAARVAADAGDAEGHARITIVPPGEDRAWLRAIPVTAIALSAPRAKVPLLETQLVETLRRWGITTLGELGDLPRGGVVARLGRAGREAHDQALGHDGDPFRPYTPPPFWQEAQDVDWEITSWGELAPVLGAVLERLCARFEVAHVAADSLEIRLQLASGGHDTRAVSLAAPTNDVAPMLALIALDLEARGPLGPVTGVAVNASTVRPEAAQGGLWHPPSPALRDVAATLARLAVLVGRERVGSPRVEDSHRPDAFRMEGFSSVEASGPPRERDGPPWERDGPPWERSITAPLGFRRLRPPRPIEVQCVDDAPARLTLCDQAGGVSTMEIVVCAGPWRMSGDWWDVGVWAREEWDAVLADGMLCRLVLDRVANAWHLDGAYD
jgi:protein ImuB